MQFFIQFQHFQQFQQFQNPLLKPARDCEIFLQQKLLLISELVVKNKNVWIFIFNILLQKIVKVIRFSIPNQRPK